MLHRLNVLHVLRSFSGGHLGFSPQCLAVINRAHVNMDKQMSLEQNEVSFGYSWFLKDIYFQLPEELLH